MTDKELEQLKAEYPDSYQQKIDYLSEYMESTGKEYANHLAIIRKWAKEDENDEPIRSNTAYSEESPYWIPEI